MPAQQQQKTKGNPAHHRMGNPRLIARRTASWTRGVRKRAERNTANKQAHTANKNLLASGGKTAWQIACEKRAEKRANDPAVQKRKRAFLLSEEE